MAKMRKMKAVGFNALKSKAGKDWQILMLEGGKAENGVAVARVWYDGKPKKLGEEVNIYDDGFKQSVVDDE